MWHIGTGQRDKIFNKRRPKKPCKLGLGERGKTHNVLIRSCLVKNWGPSNPNLSSWEDYEISQHIIGTGHEWIICPVDAYHIKGYLKLWTNSAWSLQGWKRSRNPRSGMIAKKVLYHLTAIPYCFLRMIFDLNREYLYWIFVNSAYLKGIMS